MMKLYHSAQSRSTRPRWLLEEIGAPYDLVRLDMSKQDQKARATFAGVADVLSNALSGKPFMLGEQFSAADVMIGSTLAWSQFLGLLNDRPALQEYAQRLSARPAYQRATADWARGDGGATAG